MTALDHAVLLACSGQLVVWQQAPKELIYILVLYGTILSLACYQ